MAPVRKIDGGSLFVILPSENGEDSQSHFRGTKGKILFDERGSFDSDDYDGTTGSRGDFEGALVKGKKGSVFASRAFRGHGHASLVRLHITDGLLDGLETGKGVLAVKRQKAGLMHPLSRDEEMLVLLF